MVKRAGIVGPSRLAVLGLGAILSSPSAAWAACADLLPEGSAASVHGPTRLIDAQDLIGLRDIGFPDAFPDWPSALAVSPDGRRAAFVLSRADLAGNGYCRALVVLEIAPGARPRAIDTGGEIITLRSFVRGLSVDYGMPAVVTPSWSPDGQRIAYLRRDKGVTQAWVARADGSGADAVTREASDVESVGWISDDRLAFATRRRASAIRASVDAEGRSGWVYDDRVTPNSGARPKLRESDAPLEHFTIALPRGPGASEGAVPVAEEENAGEHLPEGAPGNGRRAWTAPDNGGLLSPTRLWATDARGVPVRCGAPECRDPIGYWWDAHGRELRFLRREGWNKETYTFYRWQPGPTAPRRSFATLDVIQNCVAAQAGLLCTTENATTPRRLVLLDPATGRTSLVFDPNPEFRNIRLGSVRRLRWRNDRGLEAWGDLVLPPGHRPGDRVPLVIVQYHSRGFLRGGTGDDYPIYLFAARGFAVLSFERPPPVALGMPGLETAAALNAANEAGWADRRSLLSSIEQGVRAAIATGDVDPRRVGITGLSDGATTARFALINSRMFAAAAISSCCLEPKTVMTYGGTRWSNENRAAGFPAVTRDDPSFWRPVSLSLNADHMDTPLLMQMADEEYLLALEAFEALREQGRPVELYVFPDEHHAKWQPVHRLAVYRRSLDWFDFWLRCREDPDPAKQAQYQRWRDLRARSAGAGRLCGNGAR